MAASTLAGDSSLGSASMEMTETRIVSTVWIGSHRSDAFSYPHLSSPEEKMNWIRNPFYSGKRLQ